MGEDAEEVGVETSERGVADEEGRALEGGVMGEISGEGDPF